VSKNKKEDTMSGPALTKEGQEALEFILSGRPPLILQKHRKMIFRALALIMNEQGTEEAGKELVIEATKLVLHNEYKGKFHKLEMESTQYRKMAIDIWKDMEAYYAQPKQVKRWDIPKAKAIKRPAEMKVLAICASPRAGGNTDVLIDEALRGAEQAGAQVEKIRLQEIRLSFCIHCAKCREPGFENFCALKDDMSSSIYQKVVDSNAIIIGFPIYIGRECGQLATFFDRWYGFQRFIKGTDRLGMIICSWGSPWMDSYEQVIEHFISILGAFDIVTVEALGACGLEGVLHGLDDKKKAMISRFPEEMEKAYQAGKSLVTG
jgi:multimeric flavodoxin WrbA